MAVGTGRRVADGLVHWEGLAAMEDHGGPAAILAVVAVLVAAVRAIHGKKMYAK